MVSKKMERQQGAGESAAARYKACVLLADKAQVKAIRDSNPDLPSIPLDKTQGKAIPKLVSAPLLNTRFLFSF